MADMQVDASKAACQIRFAFQTGAVNVASIVVNP
jgi:hypothetical protein